MFQYVIQRLLLTIPTVILVTIVTFVGLRVALPASALDVILSEYARTDDELRQRLEDDLGLSGSIPRQYAEWTGITWFWGGETGLLQGDFGRSLHSRQPVLGELKQRLPVSLELGLWGLVTAVATSVPLGVLSAVKQDRFADYGLRSMAILLNSVPGFWIAVMIITFGSIWFGWAPPIQFAQIYEDPVAHFKIMILPALIIGLTPSGGLLRLVRTQMLEVLRQDYIRTATAKGLGQNSVLYRHALRNAMIPLITVIGLTLPNLIAGTVIFEQIFVIPGMGRYLVDAVRNLDYPVIQGINFLFAVILVVSVVLIDISYALLDPRVRFK